MAKLFVFGTLLFPEVLTEVLGRNVTAHELKPAEAVGYRRCVLASDPTYAVLRAEQGMVARGCVVELTDEELRRVDHYEHEMYARKPIQVMVDGALIEAFAYLDDEKVPVLDRDYDEEKFRTEEMPEFLPQIKGWMKDF